MASVASVRMSILWRLMIPFVAVSVIAIVALLLYVPRAIEENAVEAAVASARKTAEQIKTIRAYYTDNVITRVLVYPIQVSHDHKKKGMGYIPSPATVIHDLNAEFEKEGTSIRQYSPYPFPWRKDRKLDEFAQSAWDTLSRNPEETVIRRDGDAVRVAVADRLTGQDCVGCHNTDPDSPKTDWKLNDVRGVLEILVPIKKQVEIGAILSTKISVGLVAAFAGLGLIMFLIIRQGLQQRLMRFSAVAAKIADGDLTQRVEEQGASEVVLIARAFNTLTSRVRELVGEIIGAASQLSGAAHQASSITGHSRELIRQQQGETTQLATAMHEMVATVQEVARNTSEAARTAQVTDEKAQSGALQSVEAMGGIEVLVQRVEAAADVINNLERESEAIGAVLDVIRGVADQTNLLALNAAIEAARAGDQGRGFAVVADEVRSLASRTQESTQEIEEMIAKLQQGAQQAVGAMEDGRSKAQESVGLVEQVAESLAEIASGIRTIHDMTSQIATAAEEQTSVSEEINRNVVAANEKAETIAEEAKQTATAAEQVAGLAARLEQLVNRFRV
ncbi:MAG: hypothetical protein Kow006_00680 [Gammaproteobacteria bacterium]